MYVRHSSILARIRVGGDGSFEFATTSDWKFDSGKKRVTLTIYAQYTGIQPSFDGPSPIDLFSTTREMEFDWSAAQQGFILSRSSAFPIGYLDWLKGEWMDEGFIEYHVDELAGIAKNGTPEQKTWLKDFLRGL